MRPGPVAVGVAVISSDKDFDRVQVTCCVSEPCELDRDGLLVRVALPDSICDQEVEDVASPVKVSRLRDGVICVMDFWSDGDAVKLRESVGLREYVCHRDAENEIVADRVTESVKVMDSMLMETS